MKLPTFVVLAVTLTLSSCSGDDLTKKGSGIVIDEDAGSSGNQDSGKRIETDMKTGFKNNSTNNTQCTQSYTTRDLNGCFSPTNSELLEYYCFDGQGSWYHEIWTPISGCGGAIERGTYSVNKCTLHTCDEKGCYDYPVGAYENGVIINGNYYSANTGCS